MKRKWVLVAGILLVIIGGAGVFLRTKIKPAQAGIQVDSTPQSKVFVNEEEVGTTPLEKTRAPGDITLRLVPQGEGALPPWSRKVTLTQGVKTVVRRVFGPTESGSTGEILSFEKTTGKTASLAVVSSPDSAEVVIDGEAIGFSPIRRDLPEGKHTIRLSRTGFSDRELAVTTEPGYKLTAVVMLAEIPSEEATLSASPSPSPTPKVAAKSSPTPTPLAGKSPTPAPKGAMVEILETPTGFLRVREEPSTAATESAKVTPGNKYPYLEQNKDASWFKIEYEKGKTGWIFAQYAKKVE